MKRPAFFDPEKLDVGEFESVLAKETNQRDFPNAGSIAQNIPLYNGPQVQRLLTNESTEREIRSEWCACLGQGPGVFVIRQAYGDPGLVDSMTAVFEEILRQEKSGGGSKGDHFGNNERIWNSFQKSFAVDPGTALDYYGNPLVALAARSWLGPGYQITAQVNIVKPGSAAQSAHRDYHLGFQSNEATVEFPAHAQVMSQYLTLQGAIAHSNMPLESGPTLLLPYSQLYAPGYLAFRHPDFVKYFESHHVQLPLEKGDALFFNPALFHGAGANTSKHDRIGNLVQISSAFGRTMESIDHTIIANQVYTILLARQQDQPLPPAELRDMISAVAEGYAFPTNLDSDPPIDGNAPQSMAELLQQALKANWPLEQFSRALRAHAAKRQP